MKDKFYRFMIGRYGTDDLTKFMVGATLGLMVINLLLRIELLNTLVLLGLFLTYFRMFSKNIQARYAENQKFLGYKRKVTGFFEQKKRMLTDLRTNHIYKCPNCGRKIRIPRGKGRIIVTCPDCRHEFEKKS